MNEIVLGLSFALMAGATILALLRPLSGPEKSAAHNKLYLAFYRDQLEEIERDLARGVLATEEADAARAEVARRLIAADDRATPETSSPILKKRVALCIMLGVPLLALCIYLAEGSPELPDTPFGARVEGPLDKLPLEALVFRVSQRLKGDPNDLKGWEVIAPAYSNLGRYKDAVYAWTRIIDIGGETAARLASLGEAKVQMGAGNINEEEREVFAKAEALDPLEPRAQYYLGVAEIEDGKQADAATRWQKLLDAGPANAPWRAGLEASLRQLQASMMAGLSPERRNKKIENMVAGLAARLGKSPHDIEGWLRLITSYDVLEKGDDARAALGRAREVFAADKSALARLDAAGKELK